MYDFWPLCYFSGFSSLFCFVTLLFCSCLWVFLETSFWEFDTDLIIRQALKNLKHKVMRTTLLCRFHLLFLDEDNWRERSLSFSRRRSEYRSIVIQYERRPKFLFGNSSATPHRSPEGLSTHASVSSFTFFVSGQEVKHKTCFYYFAATEA